jgi:hypothetical protein
MIGWMGWRAGGADGTEAAGFKIDQVIADDDVSGVITADPMQKAVRDAMVWAEFGYSLGRTGSPPSSGRPADQDEVGGRVIDRIWASR